MTPEQFVARCEAVIEQLALLYAHSSDDEVSASLDKVIATVRADWVERFKTFATPQDIAEVVADIGGRIQTRRREIEGGGGGTA